MKVLGYPYLISYASFRQPNFELMSHSLHWLMQRADSGFIYPYETSTENDRVVLIKTMCHHAQNRLHVKLNPKKLYSSDQSCVHELCKIAKMLGDASRSNLSSVSAVSMEETPHSEAKETRALASEITQDGAHLSDLLESEKDLRSARYSALSVPMEPELAEQVLEQKIREAKEEASNLKQKLTELEQDKASLTERITKKQEELERNKNRLQAWRAMKPAHLEEYARVEDEHRKLHQVYITQLQNLMYLEREMDAIYSKERVKYQQVEKGLGRMKHKIIEQQMMTSFDEREDTDTDTSEDDSIEEDLGEDNESDDFGGNSRMTRPIAKQPGFAGSDGSPPPPRFGGAGRVPGFSDERLGSPVGPMAPRSGLSRGDRLDDSADSMGRDRDDDGDDNDLDETQSDASVDEEDADDLDRGFDRRGQQMAGRGRGTMSRGRGGLFMGGGPGRGGFGGRGRPMQAPMQHRGILDEEDEDDVDLDDGMD